MNARTVSSLGVAAAAPVAGVAAAGPGVAGVAVADPGVAGVAGAAAPAVAALQAQPASELTGSPYPMRYSSLDRG